MSELLPKWIVIREDDRLEQRRYEIARDVMAAIVARTDLEYGE